MVGTAKGLFILKGSPAQGKWTIDGPHFPGLAVYSAFLDQRKGRNEMWAGPVSWHFGAELCKSTDMGKTWDQPEKRRIKMPAGTKKPLENIWQIAPGGRDDTLYVGVAPAALFESHDRGECRPEQSQPTPAHHRGSIAVLRARVARGSRIHCRTLLLRCQRSELSRRRADVLLRCSIPLLRSDAVSRSVPADRPGPSRSTQSVAGNSTHER